MTSGVATLRRFITSLRWSLATHCFRNAEIVWGLDTLNQEQHQSFSTTNRYKLRNNSEQFGDLKENHITYYTATWAPAACSCGSNTAPNCSTEEHGPKGRFWAEILGWLFGDFWWIFPSVDLGTLVASNGWNGRFRCEICFSIWQGWNPVFLSVTVMLGSGTETETGQRSLKQQMQQTISDHSCNKCCPMRMKTWVQLLLGSVAKVKVRFFVKRSGWNALSSNFKLPVH